MPDFDTSTMKQSALVSWRLLKSLPCWCISCSSPTSWHLLASRLLTPLPEDRWDVRGGETQTSQFYSPLATLLTKNQSEKRKSYLGSQVERIWREVLGAGGPGARSVQVQCGSQRERSHRPGTPALGRGGAIPEFMANQWALSSTRDSSKEVYNDWPLT